MSFEIWCARAVGRGREKTFSGLEGGYQGAKSERSNYQPDSKRKDNDGMVPNSGDSLSDGIVAYSQIDRLFIPSP